MTTSNNVVRKSPLETIEQQRLIVWADHQFFNIGQGPELIGAYLAAIPNGGSRRKQTKNFSFEAMRMKREGVRAGFPDLQLTVPIGDYHGLFIEMKRRDGVPSDIKPAQKEWHQKLLKKGYAVAVAFGFDAAKLAVCDYLKGKNVQSIYRNVR